MKKGWQKNPDIKVERTREIWCCGCEITVTARLTTGFSLYPHREDLAEVPFWICDVCLNFVGCHHKTKDFTRPLGCIATPEIKDARQHIHKLIDPIWKSRRIERKELYKIISRRLGYEYHTSEIRNLDTAREIYKLISQIKKGLNQVVKDEDLDAFLDQSQKVGG